MSEVRSWSQSGKEDQRGDSLFGKLAAEGRRVVGSDTVVVYAYWFANHCKPRHQIYAIGWVESGDLLPREKKNPALSCVQGQRNM